ncbi:MAG: hypothetical protein KA120_01170, partial [Candidatus Goldbacteria bacterium]|nr:hypothetical protein [Candidatus Goldiibacteriota bacterium]
ERRASAERIARNSEVATASEGVAERNAGAFREVTDSLQQVSKGKKRRESRLREEKTETKQAPVAQWIRA